MLVQRQREREQRVRADEDDGCLHYFKTFYTSSVATASSGVMAAPSGMVGQTTASAGGAEAALHKFALLLALALVLRD